MICFFKTFFLFFYIKYWLLCEERKVRQLYYQKSKFRLIDEALKKSYRGKNPYRISKKFLIEMGKNQIHCYGETPLTTLELILRECAISASDYVYELGGGRGRTAFFLHAYWGCKVRVFEWIESFVRNAQKIAQEFSCEGILFSHSDYFFADLKEATIIYLYGTCLSEEEIQKLLPALSIVGKGTKIITVSFALQQYSDDFCILKQFQGSYPWGMADIYLNTRKKNEGN